MNNKLAHKLFTTCLIFTIVYASHAQYDYALASSNPFSLVTLDNYATPTLGDIDGDGDLDLFVGQVGSNTILFYRNTGTSQAPVYEAQTGQNNPLDTFSNNSGCVAPVLVDIDGDNDLDAFVGIWINVIKYYKNEGDTASPDFKWLQGADNPLVNVFTDDICSYASFVDIDGDQDFDAFITDGSGNIEFYENTGDQNTPVFLKDSLNNPLDHVSLTARAKIAFHDVNGDGLVDAVIGHDLPDPELLYYQNTGTQANAIFEEKAGTDNPFVNITGPTSVVPIFADIDDDGDDDLILGVLSAVQLYEATESTTAVNDLSDAGKVLFYPNPTKDILHIEGDGILSIQIISAQGSLIRHIETEDNVATIDLSNEAKGIYFVQLIALNGITTGKIILN
jgi:Secretion system C-terminal sorting domain/FG-GAP-like repeat